MQMMKNSQTVFEFKINLKDIFIKKVNNLSLMLLFLFFRYILGIVSFFKLIIYMTLSPLYFSISDNWMIALLDYQIYWFVRCYHIMFR